MGPLPTLHDLEWPPKRTRIGPPNPSRFAATPEKDRDGTHEAFTIWRLFPFRNLTNLDGSTDRGCTSQPFTKRSGSQRTRIAPFQPFTIWRLFPSQPHSWFAVTSPAQPHRKPTVSSGTRQDSLTESPIQKGTDTHRKPTCTAFCLTTTPSSTASQKAHCFFRHPPGQPTREPATESPHAVLLVSSQLPPAQSQKATVSSGSRQDS